MKLASKVAGHGSVLAEDILGESLTFLWIRAFLHHQSNIRVIHGDPDDPRLPKGAVDAVLIANAYHEFTNPLAVLDHTFRSLRSDGRLVVLERCSGDHGRHQGSEEEVQRRNPGLPKARCEDRLTSWIWRVCFYS
jgi:ubiquinone/menaquinone biosynthesis C-methylase UbiE